MEQNAYERSRHNERSDGRTLPLNSVEREQRAQIIRKARERYRRIVGTSLPRLTP
ncbi:hypothetical protein [Embleya scabrispora]|uniref:hypothetical protein n=1 Tax=Embleya scabrispora TaxID=159449 RepID=UPI001374DFCF|nr:hypothetical protein [Embleya scabrispora]